MFANKNAAIDGRWDAAKKLGNHNQYNPKSQSWKNYERAFENQEALMKSLDLVTTSAPKPTSEISTGWPTLDELTKSGGFAKGELMIFIAKPSIERKSMLTSRQNTHPAEYTATYSLKGKLRNEIKHGNCDNLHQSKSDI